MDVKKQAFAQALQAFTYLATLDLNPALTGISDPKLIDALQNGKAQKFEYACELCWKAVKVHLLQTLGIEESSPKKVAKAMYLASLLNEGEYLLFIAAIDDRNQLSHVYSEAVFNEIIQRMPNYAVLFEKILTILNQETL